MKKLLAFFLCLLLVLPGLAACDNSSEVSKDTGELSADEVSGNTADNTSGEASAEVSDEVSDSKEDNSLDKDKKYNILFVGNSYTYYYEMPTRFFAKIAEAAGYDVEVTAITNGGHYLHEYDNPKDEYGAKLHDALKNNKYDYVILQEQSNNAISDPQDFYEAVRSLNKKITDTGAAVCLYSTWGYSEKKTSSPTVTAFGKDTAEMEMKIRAAYAAIAEETGALRAPAGSAMTYCLDKEGMVIYDGDGTHPATAGSCMAAMTIFCTIFGVDPVDIDYSYPALGTKVMKTVKDAVAFALGDGMLVDEAYKTTTEPKDEPLPPDNSDDPNNTPSESLVVLSQIPESDIISVVTKDSFPEDSTWRAYHNNVSKSFSGIRGDKNAIASPSAVRTENAKTEPFTEAEKADAADIGYGISIIGLGRMDDRKGAERGIVNLVNGHWGTSYMAGIYFDGNRYSPDGTKKDGGEYCALITLNFGEVKTFDAIGYFSGGMKNFPQAQDVFVSDDGVSWTKVPSACYNVVNGDKLVNIEEAVSDPWADNVAKAESLCSMEGVTGKYIRIGVIYGGAIDDDTMDKLPDLEVHHINTRELVVYGK